MKSRSCDRIKEMLYETGLRQIDVVNRSQSICERYGIKPITKPQLSEWVHGKYSPNQWYLTVLGDIFGVNEVWLMGADVPKYKEASTQASSAEADFELIDLFSRLTDENKATVLAVINGLIASQDK